MISSFVRASRPVFFLILPCLLMACGDDNNKALHQDGGGTLPDSSVGLDTGSAGDAGVADGGGDDTAAVPPAPLGLALLHSNGETSSLSLLTSTGEIAKDDCLHSGSTAPILTKAFSGDVGLPSQIQPNNALVILDRETAVLTYLDPATCTVLRQINVSTGFRANPHDVVGVSPTKAYVSRYSGNLDKTPGAGDLDEGNDVLVFNPETGALIKRIDLLPFAVPSAKNEPTLPRADRMVSVGDKVYVSLNNLSENYKAAGHGRIVIIDTKTDDVVGHVDLPTHSNCGALNAFGSSLFVACGGAFSDAESRAARAGIVRISLPSNELATLGTPVFANSFMSLFSFAVMDENRVAAITLGDFSGTPDRIWGANFATSTAEKGFDGSKAYSLWSVLADRARGIVWATDAGTQPALRSFTMAPTGALAPLPVVQTSLTRKLPPRELAWY